MRNVLLASALALLSGCLGLRENVISATDVDGSSDHRIFRIGALTKVMLEPVLWRLEDRHLIDFDRPVTDYFKDRLPPEFETVTLRMLHDNQSGLPLDLLDPWCLGDMGACWTRLAFGADACRWHADREAMVARLWDVRFRKTVERREPQPSDVGYALMMMAICDHLGRTLDDLCEEHIIAPYGLTDTAFVPTAGMRTRLTRACAGGLPLFRFAGSEIDDHRGTNETALFSGGMVSSPYDILRVAYVIQPHLDRAKGLFEEHEVDGGRKVWVLTANTYGGRAFIGFDPEDGHVVLIVRNDTGFRLKEGFELMQNLIHPPMLGACS